MQDKMPVRLAREPIIEAIWELRFQSHARSVADVLPGLVYSALRDEYPQIARLPAADIPQPVAEQDQALRYMPKIAMHAENKTVLLGERVVSLSVRRPYPGWARFSADIRSFIKVVRTTGLIDEIERFSLKYVDVINIGAPPTLHWLNMTLRLGTHDIGVEPTQVRAEIADGDLTHLVQAISPAEVTLVHDGETIQGVLFEIDSVQRMKPGESWTVVEDGLDSMHASSKRMFFSLLTVETLELLEPIYEE